MVLKVMAKGHAFLATVGYDRNETLFKNLVRILDHQLPIYLTGSTASQIHLGEPVKNLVYLATTEELYARIQTIFELDEVAKSETNRYLMFYQPGESGGYRSIRIYRPNSLTGLLAPVKELGRVAYHEPFAQIPEIISYFEAAGGLGRSVIDDLRSLIRTGRRARTAKSLQRRTATTFR